MIPRFKPWLGSAELGVLFRRNKGAVERFEQEFAAAFGAADAVAFPYGRSALWAFLKAVGVAEAGVVMPAYTCSVVAHAVSLSGNRPQFVDIRLDDYNMNLELLPTAITAETRAVIATHLFGYPLDLERVESIVREAEERYGHKIWLIQDCAHSFGASWKGRLVGSSGDVALYALNVSKLMTSVFGGMLTFQDRDLANRVRLWRDIHFVKPGPLKGLLRRAYLLATYLAFSRSIYPITWWLQEKTRLLDRFTEAFHLDDQIRFPPDYRERMLDVEAAVGRVQLEKYPEMLARRRKNAAYLARGISPRKGWVLPPMVEGATYSHYVIRVPERGALVAAAAKDGLQLGELIQYSVPELTCYADISANCPNARVASVSMVNVPVGPWISARELGTICKRVNGL